MPRRFFKKLSPRPELLHGRWFMRPFGARLADSRLWAVHRRAITGAFGAGLAICFVPLPVHLPLAAIVAILGRLNIPVLLATVMLVNPFTVIPVYYAAYRVGVLALGLDPQPFRFELSWDWLQNGLGPMWKPFLLGCLLCSTALGLAGWLGLEGFWRWSVNQRYRSRRERSSA